MASISNYVDLTISVNTVGLARAGFGVPLILSATASWVERVRYYNDLAGVAADFPVTTSAEYRAAQVIFSQSPAPKKIAIGRSALKPTMSYELSAITPTSNVSYAYKVNVKGKGFADTTVTFTSDASPTDAEYAAGMVAALNGVASKNYTASGSASPITISGNAAGDWFSIEVVDVNTQKVTMVHADPGVATDLTAINLEQSDWYALYTLYNSKAYAQAAADWVESNRKIYLSDSCDTNSILTAAGNGEWLDTIKTNAYTRTGGVYHPSPAAMLGAGLLGRCLPKDPGSVIFHAKSLNNVPPVVLTATHRTNLTDRRAGCYETAAPGLNLSFEGKVGSSVMGYLDVRRDLDWVEDDMTKSVLEVLAANDKVPMNDIGITLFESAVRASLQRAMTLGIFNKRKPNVTVPKAADISSGNKAARILPDIKWSEVLANATHKVIVNGTVTN